MTHVSTRERPFLGLLAWLVLGLIVAVLHSCGPEPTKSIQTAGKSFFPLAVGNKWIFTCERVGDGKSLTDTVRIDAKTSRAGSDYYRLRASWPGFREGLWVRRDTNGNLSWSADGLGPEHRFLLIDVPVGSVWPTGLPDCVDSLSMQDDYAVVTTPYGRFDGAREIGDIGRCVDAGWGIRLARGVGPVEVSWITIAGPNVFLLTNAMVKDDSTSMSSRSITSPLAPG